MKTLKAILGEATGVARLVISIVGGALVVIAGLLFLASIWDNFTTGYFDLLAPVMWLIVGGIGGLLLRAAKGLSV